MTLSHATPKGHWRKSNASVFVLIILMMDLTSVPYWLYNYFGNRTPDSILARFGKPKCNIQHGVADGNPAQANLVLKENVEKLTTLANQIGDYLSVMKPPIALLNVFVGIAAILLAAGFEASIASILVITAAGFFSAGGAGAINCYIDRELDKHMTRTRNRPIPSGRISANRILTLGLALSFAGIGLAVVYLNYLTAFFIGMGIFWYIFVYTLWLKPRTKWNIVIGGAAGCFSALAGWSAVTGAVSLEGLLVAALIFLWTPGHFWGLAIAKTKDYSEVEVPMLPVVEGISRASFYTALSNALLFPFTIALFLLTVNWSNAVAAVVVGAILAAINIRFLIANIRLARVPDQFKAWKVFKLSAQYLFFVLVLIVIGHIF